MRPGSRASDLQPAGLRAHAEQCRTLAKTFRDASVRTKMLNIADGYEQMADSADRMEKWLRAPGLAH